MNIRIKEIFCSIIKKIFVRISHDLKKKTSVDVLRTVNPTKEDHETWSTHHIEVNSGTAKSLCQIIIGRLTRYHQLEPLLKSYNRDTVLVKNHVKSICFGKL